MELNHTHDVSRRSWLDSANSRDSDFPLQNLPFCVFRRRNSGEPWRGGVGIGDQIVDLAALHATKCLQALAADAARAAAGPVLNPLLELGREAWQALRHALFGLLEAGCKHEMKVRETLVPQADAEHAVPVRIGDYTDFYTSLDHAVNCCRQFGTEVDPNFDWLPIAYHGRVSSIDVSGQPVFRPMGQMRVAHDVPPIFGPCRGLDYELEVGVVIGQGNARGTSIPLASAQQHMFGLCLLNDWSARDIQAWEMKPLGPFLAKNFATTLSPWLVTLEALLPYRTRWTRDANRPQPLDYLAAPENTESGAFDIQLEVSILSATQLPRGSQPTALTRTSFRHQYWTLGQMIAHHTVGGCNLQCGDLLGSGTVSGPTPGEAGALIELTLSGTRPVDIGSGERRGFLEDGDTVIFRGWCERPGYARIGFGINYGTVLPMPGTT
ncbi:fumarylacetoacetase [Burkholderia multivorans]|uniref:fumarylacetoacetase n=2 Tax=Burkholderia multivorans TaxID=87883 RepID=UPI00075815CD|nr:fumarylacetoacetase [Burkholderia multivorans]KWF64708.1 fumarylacetoacetase [Burkholderia multivorans]KWF82078.1 fumarylacetoacetase [Burkholderia multivorans]